MPDKSLQHCGRRGGILQRVNRATRRAELKLVRFHCGKKNCPVCCERRKKRLLYRLRAVKWPGVVQLWTITTDPKIIDPQEALETLNRRWHVVHRSLLRIVPLLRYFRVIEFTESGLPHMHLITDTFIDWHQFQKILIAHQFGEVLHFKTLPTNAALRYATKYVSKAVYNTDTPAGYQGRFWASSVALLPQITYSDGNGEWELIWQERSLWRLESMFQHLYVHLFGEPPPTSH